MIYYSARFRSGTLLFVMAFFFIQCWIACGSDALIPPDVVASLKSFGAQESKFRRVVQHFQQVKDPLKLDACFFIIKNISGLRSVKMDTVNDRYIPEDDISALSEESLIQHVDLAVESCRKSLSAGTLSFSDFCEYVLPYRIDNEPLADWRPAVRQQFSAVVDSLSVNAKPSDTILCNAFNAELSRGFKYVSSGNLSRFKGWAELSADRMGNCVEMCKFISYPLRAYGIPVTTDFTPCWANTNGEGHMWNVLVHSNAKNAPFMGLEASPSRYNPFIIIENTQQEKSTYRVCGKVFRRTFSINKNSLAAVANGREIIPETFASDRILDVTSEYFSVGRIQLQLDTAYFSGSAVKIAYLGVFSNGQWLPTAWAIADSKGAAGFGNMAVNVMYIPMVRSTFSFSPISYPVYLKANGKMVTLIPDTNNLTALKIDYLKSRESEQLDTMGKFSWDDNNLGPTMEMIANDIVRSRPLKGVDYTLHYWENGWRRIGTSRLRVRELWFKNVPSNGLYRLTSSDNHENKERCFTVENGRQIWW